MNRLVALLTDFGSDDPYAGQVAAVVAAASEARVVSLTHGVPRHDIQLGSHIADASLELLPTGGVLLAVVDPGVGTERRGLIVRRDGRWLVGPDNGLLTPATGDVRCWVLDRPETWRASVAPTFHARDIFAPVAARLADYERPEWLGSPIEDPVRIERPAARVDGSAAQGEVVHVDTFGNLVTNVPASFAQTARRLETRVGDTRIEGLAATYGSGDEPVAVVGSWNLLEVAVPNGSAAHELRCHVGDAVLVRAHG
ncbi:MAG: SAM-dependent chlorinase/fluorinase [Chloroflexi bacterium]|nr:SAM-dependent chlorinase/fluorinase [Chloroflexota bacterium]MCY3958011.1 SAM-dependent chlorinase/fluorinase [Chloroflexota bacterium]